MAVWGRPPQTWVRRPVRHRTTRRRHTGRPAGGRSPDAAGLRAQSPLDANADVRVTGNSLEVNGFRRGQCAPTVDSVPDTSAEGAQRLPDPHRGCHLIRTACCRVGCTSPRKAPESRKGRLLTRPHQFAGDVPFGSGMSHSTSGRDGGCAKSCASSAPLCSAAA